MNPTKALSAEQALAISAARVTIGANVFGKNSEELHEARHASLVEYAIFDLGSRPEPGYSGVMEHRPFPKHSLRTFAKVPQLHFKMPVIMSYAVVGLADHRSRSFQQLNVNVSPANESPGDLVARVAPSSIQKNGVERCLVVAKRAR